MTFTPPATAALRKTPLEQVLIVLLVLAMYLLPGRAPLLPISWHGFLLPPLLFVAAALHTRRLLMPATLPYWALLAVLFISALAAGRVGTDVFRPVLFGLLTTIALMAAGRRIDLRVLFWVLLPILLIDALLGMVVRAWIDTPQWLVDIYAGPMGRPLHRGAFFLLGMLAVGAVYLKTGRLWLIMPFIILVTAIIVTGLRGVWVGGVAGLVAMALLDRRARSLVLLTLAAASFFAVQQGIRARVERTGDLAVAVGSGQPLPPVITETQPPPATPVQPPQSHSAPSRQPPAAQPQAAPPPAAETPAAGPPPAAVPEASTAAPSSAEVQGATFALDFFLKSGTAKFLEELTPAGRLGYWQAGARMAAARPVLGVGPGNFPEEFPHYSSGVRRDAELTSDPHSMYFGTLAELGVAGAAVLLLILLAASRAIWRHRRSLRARTDLVATAAGVAALCAIGLTWDIHVQRVWWLSLGLFGLAASAGSAESDPA